MSNVSNIHTARVHEPKVSKAFEGQRLVVTTAKGTKTAEGKIVYGEHLQQTMSTSIPILTSAQIDWNSSRIQGHATDYFMRVQNELMLEGLKSGIKSWSSEELEIDALCAYLETTNQGERWDAERVASWFGENVAPHIFGYYESKGKTEAWIESKLEVFTKGFSAALGAKTRIPLLTAQKLLEILRLMPQEDMVKSAIALRFYKRLDDVVNPKLDINDELGLDD
jgi:hypothetical protein